MSSRRGPLVLASVLVGCSIGSGSARVFAQTPQVVQPEITERRDRTPTIVLLFEPDQPDSNRLVAAIESHLAGLPIRVALEPLPHRDILGWLESGHVRARARQALGLLAIDTAQADVWRLFFLDVDGAPTLIRRLRPSPEHAPLDEAGVAVRLLVEALLDSRRAPEAEPLRAANLQKAEASSARVPAKERGAPKTGDGSPPRAPPRQAVALGVPPGSVAPPSNSPQAIRGGHRLAVFLGPVGTTWILDQPWTFGALGGVALQLAPAWSAAVAYAWYPPRTYHLAGADLTLTRFPLISYAAYTPLAGFSPRLWLGLAIDPVRRETVATSPGYLSTATQTTWVGSAVGGLGFVTPAVSSLSARVDFGIDVSAHRVEYVTKSESRAVLASTRRASPFLSICLDLRL